MTEFFIQDSDIIIKLSVALGLGLLIGAERLLVREAAGMKTHALVSMGAAIFMIISEAMTQKYISLAGFNPAMIPAQIVVGIGFLGAGSIIFQNSRLIGLTTAGGLWVTAGIGMAVGFGLFGLATLATLLVLFILVVINLFERPIKKISSDIDPSKI